MIRSFFRFVRALVAVCLILTLTMGCQLLGYNKKVIRSKHRTRPYNHVRDGHKKKTHVYRMKDY